MGLFVVIEFYLCFVIIVLIVYYEVLVVSVRNFLCDDVGVLFVLVVYVVCFGVVDILVVEFVGISFVFFGRIGLSG